MRMASIVAGSCRWEAVSVHSDSRDQAGVRSVDDTGTPAVIPPGLLSSAGGRLSSHNASARRMLGPSVESAEPLLWVEGLRAEHQAEVLDALAAAMATGHRDSMTAAVDRPDGTTLWLRIATMPSFDTGGVRIGYAVTLLDTTAEHTAREAAEREEDQAWLMATYDGLTGLPNRAHFNDRLDQALDRTRLGGPPAAVLFCNLDHFRQVNDRYGRSTGDALLVEVTDRLTANVRDTDTVCHIGGDEFVVLCEAFDDFESLETLGRRLIDAVNVPVRLVADDGSNDAAAADDEEDDTTIGICIGIASATATSTADEVLAAAEAAAHQAKRNGRNGYVTSGSRYALFGT
jgi:diguanylate cyclase (GGDEF)-like protein/PAS domain S-box-containing protein